MVIVGAAGILSSYPAKNTQSGTEHPDGGRNWNDRRIDDGATGISW